MVLALFVPLIISSGGNSGSQATTLIIRAMAMGEVGLRDWWRISRREFSTGLVLGSFLGVIGMTRIVVWQGSWHTYGPHYPLMALTVAGSLIGVVLFGAWPDRCCRSYCEDRARSGERVRAIRGDAGGCDRAGHLLHGRARDHAGNVALS